MRALIGVLLVGAMICTGCARGITNEPYGVSGTTAAVFGGVVTDTGGEVEYWVEYGTSTAYGAQTEHQTVTLPDDGQTGFIVQIDGLQRATTYHYRVCARDSQQTGGPGCGEDRQFTTTNVDCGDTITTDLRLSGDLDCVESGERDGLVVGADGIDIDLAGHAVRGLNFALENRGGFDDVRIRGGALYAYRAALVLEGASRNRINGVSVGLPGPFAGPLTSTGIEIEGGTANVVRNSGLHGSSSGLSATDSPGLLVADSTGFAGSGSRGSGPVVSVRGDLARVVRNDFQSSISVNGSSNRIVSNRVRGVIYGIGVFAGHDNLVADNDVHDTVTLLFAPDAGDGILVGPAAVDSRLRGNVVTSSDDDGIEVQGPTTRLRDNTADANDDFGIDAVEGVIDLGGNTASGNGNPLQCRNVFCGS